MGYQELILKKYRKTFPDKTLKEISEETGIQMTRVFRIFNGSEMKLKEYESFERSLSKSAFNPSKFELLAKFQNCLRTLGDRDLSQLEIELNHILKINDFVHKPFIEHASPATAL